VGSPRINETAAGRVSRLCCVATQIEEDHAYQGEHMGVTIGVATLRKQATSKNQKTAVREKHLHFLHHLHMYID
jgi:hypothetical protein